MHAEISKYNVFVELQIGVCRGWNPVWKENHLFNPWAIRKQGTESCDKIKSTDEQSV
jgi:hypothetical protein